MLNQTYVPVGMAEWNGIFRNAIYIMPTSARYAQNSDIFVLQKISVHFDFSVTSAFVVRSHD